MTNYWIAEAHLGIRLDSYDSKLEKRENVDEIRHHAFKNITWKGEDVTFKNSWNSHFAPLQHENDESSW